MIRTLSLAAALAVLPLSAAVADQSPSEAAVEAAAEAFEARMEAFGERAEAIADDASLTEAERETRIARLWAEYQPEVAVFTAAISRHAGEIAREALAHVDLEALVEETLADPEVQSAVAAGQGMARNGAWSRTDPEQLITYGLMAQYSVDKAVDAMAEATAAAGEPEDD